MRRVRFTVIKNAIANVTRGGASAFVALSLPHFLVRSLDHDRFAAWSLMLQIAAFASFLDFGLQTAVARYVAHLTELGEVERRNSLASTALALLSIAGAVAFLVILVVVWQFPHLFRGVPAPLLREALSGVMLTGGASALFLPFSTWSGILIGLHRNEFVAIAVGGSRILGAIAVIAVSQRTHSLVVLAACIVCTNLLGCVAQVFAARRLVPNLRLRWKNASQPVALELGRYCGGLTVWNLSMFLVSGLDVTIVGYFDFKAVGTYSIAASLITLFAGANSAVCSALMTPVAALHAAGQIDRVRSITITATRLNTFINMLATVGIFLCGPFLLRVWVGQAYAQAALPIVEVLMVANAIRLIGNPYASMLIATDQQKHGIAQGAVEGLTNFASSVPGAIWLGPIGVAVGTLVGAVFGVAWIPTFTLRWVKEMPLKRWNFVREGIFRPLLCGLPLVLYVAVMRHSPMTWNSAVGFVICCLGSYVLTDRFGNVLPASLKVHRAVLQAE